VITNVVNPLFRSAILGVHALGATASITNLVKQLFLSYFSGAVANI
jgi:hypothetical protein